MRTSYAPRPRLTLERAKKRLKAGKHLRSPLELTGGVHADVPEPLQPILAGGLEDAGAPVAARRGTDFVDVAEGDLAVRVVEEDTSIVVVPDEMAAGIGPAWVTVASDPVPVVHAHAISYLPRFSRADADLVDGAAYAAAKTGKIEGFHGSHGVLRATGCPAIANCCCIH